MSIRFINRPYTYAGIWHKRSVFLCANLISKTFTMKCSKKRNLCWRLKKKYWQLKEWSKTVDLKKYQKPSLCIALAAIILGLAYHYQTWKSLQAYFEALQHEPKVSVIAALLLWGLYMSYRWLKNNLKSNTLLYQDQAQRQMKEASLLFADNQPSVKLAGLHLLHQVALNENTNPTKKRKTTYTSIVKSILHDAVYHHSKLFPSHIVQQTLHFLFQKGNPYNFHEADLSKCNLQEMDLRECDLSNVDLSNANLSCCDLSDSKLVETSLHEADLSGSCIANSNLQNAYLVGADIRQSVLSSTNLTKAYLKGTNLRDSILYQAKLRKAYLVKAICQRASFCDADLNHANAKAAQFEDCDFRSSKLMSINLRRANLRNADLSNADLRFARLNSCNLSNANLQNCNIGRVNYLIDSRPRIDKR
ncbi:MAG: pentapeptide repeat-containing protein, partial [Bacteroidales bacterium]